MPKRSSFGLGGLAAGGGGGGGAGGRGGAALTAGGGGGGGAGRVTGRGAGRFGLTGGAPAALGAEPAIEVGTAGALGPAPSLDLPVVSTAPDGSVTCTDGGDAVAASELLGASAAVRTADGWLVAMTFGTSTVAVDRAAGRSRSL